MSSQSSRHDALSMLEGAFHREIRGMLTKKQQAAIMAKFREVVASNLPLQQLPDVDVLAQEIRRVDGNHDLGAGALAEALLPFLQDLGYSAVSADMVRQAEHYCPTDMPSFAKWEWKAAHIRQAMLATQKMFDIPAFLRRDGGQPTPVAPEEPFTGADAWIRSGGTASGYAAHRADIEDAERAR